MTRNYPLLNYSSPEAETIDLGVKANTTDDVLDLLNDESTDDKSDKSDKKEIDSDEMEKDSKEKKENTDDESDEDEEKLELSDDEDDKEIDDKDDELLVPARKKEILAKYPKLFKEFPHLERSYYKEQQLAELGIVTMDDAKEVLEKGKTLDAFETDLMQGNTEKILRAVKESSPDAFAKISDNYLQTLGKVDKETYFTVVGNLHKHTIMSMVSEGKRLGEEKGSALSEAAAVLNQFLFGSSEWEPPKKLAKESNENSESEKIKKEREEFDNEKLTSAKSDIDGRLDGVIKNTITENIDKNDSMPPYVKKNAIRETQEIVKDLMVKDKVFMGMIDRLYKSAKDDKYSRASLDKVLVTYRSKARTLLPDVIKKVRNDALRGIGSKKESSEDKRGQLQGTRKSTSSNDSGKSESSKGKRPAGMSEMEWMLQD